MSAPSQYWLVSVFVLAAVASVAGLVLMVTGNLRVDSEILGLAVGGVLVVLLWLGIAR